MQPADFIVLFSLVESGAIPRTLPHARPGSRRQHDGNALRERLRWAGLQGFEPVFGCEAVERDTVVQYGFRHCYELYT